MTQPTRLLIVDDDAGLRDLVAGFLGRHGFDVDSAGDAAAMRRRLDEARYDLIVLDVMMPGEDGLSVLRRLQKDDGPPVIMLSAVGTDVDRIVGLEIGAEDYLAKPCNPRELLARIRTVLRRHATSTSHDEPARPSAADAAREKEQLRFAGWRLDLAAHVVHDPEGAVVALSDGEFRLLRAFAQQPRRVLTRDQLLTHARGADVDRYDRAIDVQVSRLRRKLAAHHADELIRTVRNEGYLFVPAVEHD